MGNYTSIKVSKKTLKRLHKLAREIAQERGERISLEDAINKILNEHNQEKHREGKRKRKIEEDRKVLISLMQKKVKGAGPNDFLEYDYRDIGGG